MAIPADRKLTGLVAATYTPLTVDSKINLSVIGPYVDYLIKKQGVKNIFVNGTTGESMSLTIQERKDLAVEWCKQAKGKMDQVIVHVGCQSLEDCQELARHAVENKADAIAVIAPSFFKPANADALRSFLVEVASVAPNMPFYYYHLPAVTGVNVPVRDVLPDIETHIPSFRGVKFSGKDLMDLGMTIQLSCSHSNWSVLYGVDEQLLAGLAMGANGAVGSTYNYIGCDMNELISAFDKGELDKARKIQFKLQELLSYGMEFGFNLGVNKRLMIEVSGLDLGPPRLPVMPCPDDVAMHMKKKFHILFTEC